MFKHLASGSEHLCSFYTRHNAVDISKVGGGQSPGSSTETREAGRVLLPL